MLVITICAGMIFVASLLALWVEVDLQRHLGERDRRHLVRQAYASLALFLVFTFCVSLTV
ncbi:hypothetical protein [Methylobacterium nodulans]|uniref:Uncharacterized protein n=1 Tax=Methylobacterium nodulans (strain LMG 21967 / CNCM I-2342 / ORS 2060) TaxID=460265 RepID=B8II94_METNO|nr:hypothetical protein [Methylobacterium nodulans]ACL57963.1 hypothetical protein Mnod_3020 [Methylobacterium nodulans ORS 2060]